MEPYTEERPPIKKIEVYSRKKLHSTCKKTRNVRKTYENDFSREVFLLTMGLRS